MENIALLVMSCDKYHSVWYPYFELIKKFWPDHPQKIYLSTETKKYSCAGIEITTINSQQIEPWGKRLYDVLQCVNEDFIIFSLEDFFLLGPVDDHKIEECLSWMRNDKTIAECRLTTYDTVTEGEFYKDSKFRICPVDHPFRVDTQFAIWRKSYLLSVINTMETPWQFEGRASERSRKLTDKLLWYSPENIRDLNTMIVPYYNKPIDGYGIAYGKWLFNNKSWFEKNGINGVEFRGLGTLSMRGLSWRNRWLYSSPKSLVGKFIKTIYLFYVYADRVVRGFIINGIQDVKNTLCILKSRRL